MDSLQIEVDKARTELDRAWVAWKKAQDAHCAAMEKLLKARELERLATL